MEIVPPSLVCLGPPVFLRVGYGANQLHLDETALFTRESLNDSLILECSFKFLHMLLQNNFHDAMLNFQ